MMFLRTRSQVVLAMSIAFVAGCAAIAPMKGRIEADRYISPDGEFSVALDRDWGPSQETVFVDRVLVDLAFRRDPAAVGVFGLQTIEWLKLPKVLGFEEFRSSVAALASEHVAKRFGPTANFTLHEGAVVREKPQPAYRFVATGTVNNRPASWQGEVLLFDDRVAIVSFVSLRGGLAKAEPRGLVEFTDGVGRWIQTLRREK
jgi:hypothetical protein